MNYTLLIIEDEALEQKALCRYIEEHFPQIISIFTAKNSREALTVAYREKPNIYLIDINIPGKSGLSIIEELNDRKIKGKFIITTAYDTFDYAKKAVSLNCTDFLLKPIQELELTKALKKCFSEIEEQRTYNEISECLDNARHYNEASVFKALCYGQDISGLLLSVYGWPQDGCLSSIFLCWQLPFTGTAKPQTGMAHTFLRRLLSPVFRIISMNDHQKIWAFIQPKRKAEHSPLSLSLWMTCNAILQDYGGTIQVSPCCQDYAALSEVFSAIGTVKKQTLPENQPYLDIFRLVAKPLSTIPQRTLVRQRLVQRLRENTYPRLSALLERLCLQYGLLPTLHVFLEALMSYGYTASQIIDIADPWDNAVLNNLLVIVKEVPAEKETDAASDAIDTAQKLMQKYCGSSLSQSEIAEEVGLSQAYFSRLFKKKTGNTFVNALTELRMERAKELLTDESLSITEIAVLCGYTSKKYFKQTFYTKYGLSVEDYRKKLCI